MPRLLTSNSENRAKRYRFTGPSSVSVLLSFYPVKPAREYFHAHQKAHPARGPGEEFPASAPQLYPRRQAAAPRIRRLEPPSKPLRPTSGIPNEGHPCLFVSRVREREGGTAFLHVELGPSI